ncbi:hypothetical protein BST61_g7831 [Cercospora zeina]
MGRYIPNAFNLAVVVYVALGSTACSYGLAVLGSTIGQPSFFRSLHLTQQGEPGYERTANLFGAFNGVSSAGACLGAIFNSWSADALSRKHTIQLGAAILSIGAGLCAGAVNVGMFIFARLPLHGLHAWHHGRYEEAEAVLKRLHTRTGDTHQEQAAKEFYQMKKQLEQDRALKAKISKFELFKTASNRKRALICAAMMWFNMFTGVLIIANYAIIIFTSLGLSGSMPLLLLALWVTASFPGNILTALYVDRFGRRKFMLVGALGLTFSLLFETIFQALYTGTTNHAGQRAAIFFIFLFIIFWSSCFDATQYLYMAEIFPTDVRGQGTAWAMANQFAAQIVIVVAGPIALERIGWRFFLVLLCPTACHVGVLYFFFPETKNRSLEDINAEFGDVVAVHYFGATEEEQKEYAKAIEAEQKTSANITCGAEE